MNRCSDRPIHSTPPEYERVPQHLRREIVQRAQQLCEYCRCPEAFSCGSFAIDHIQPCQLGGAMALENLAWSCFGCNGRKYTKVTAVDPLTQQEVPLLNLRQ
ncbi:MAG: HNH endonuclease signature motif containing protein [Cyanobacteria bacterium P01_A01_bin.123]